MQNVFITLYRLIGHGSGSVVKKTAWKCSQTFLLRGLLCRTGYEKVEIFDQYLALSRKFE